MQIVCESEMHINYPKKKTGGFKQFPFSLFFYSSKHFCCVSMHSNIRLHHHSVSFKDGAFYNQSVQDHGRNMTQQIQC